MDIKEMVDKAFENKTLQEIKTAATTALQGISEKGAEVLQSVLNAKTVQDLADSKYVKNAQDIVSGSIQNLKDAVDKAWENKTLQEIADAGLEALQGISPEGAAKLREVLHVKTVKELAENKHVVNAQKISKGA
jgi:hypothetical protein